MPPTTIGSCRFDQDANGAKRAVLEGPVFITDRGRPAHVLLGIEAYRVITGEAAEAEPSCGRGRPGARIRPWPPGRPAWRRETSTSPR